MKNQYIELDKFGQSIWLDNISRDILNKKELQRLIEEVNLKGVTSNPSIFQKAMAEGHAYDQQISDLLKTNPDISAEELFEELSVKDIQDAADVLYPVYQKTNGYDGYVSIEVAPALAFNTEGTMEEARRLHNKVNRPNLMVKIPATAEGIPAIRQMIVEGLNINITLIFSRAVYETVAEAFIQGLEERVEKGLPINNIASVASFFVSRIDSLVDKLLGEKGNTELKGKIAVANAKLAYLIYKEKFFSERFEKLRSKGAKVQRLLWASTSTKNPDYPATIYVDELIGKDTVNTMPPATIVAFGETGKPANTLEANVEDAKQQIKMLNDVGINFTEVTDKLTADGVQLFAEAFTELIKGIEKKKNSYNFRKTGQQLYGDENLLLAVKKRLENWKKNDAAGKVWRKDAVVWKSDPKDNVELSNRLGWLDLPTVMLGKSTELTSFAEEVRKDFTNIVLLGMGGSSLAPEVFFKTFGKKEGYPSLRVLDSTHPLSVRRILDNTDLKKTIFIVASKSGGTTETMSFFYEFYDALTKLGAEAGAHFIAITDSGSSLQAVAKEKKFRKIFITPEEVGGRYSALTYFGLVPAALIGVEINKFLAQAVMMEKECAKDSDIETSGGFTLGAFIGECALRHKDKLTFFVSESISSFPVWIEQLVAESTGKEGKGILPVEGEKPLSANMYNKDRVFVHINVAGDNSDYSSNVTELKNAGFPVVEINVNDNYEIGKEMYRWEIATAMAGSILGINPFDQPNVQLAKTLATESMNEYTKTGKLPVKDALLSVDGLSAYASKNVNSSAKDIKELLGGFFNEAGEGNYAALMAFLPHTEEMENALIKLRSKIQSRYKIPVTLGFGPRFLHSTGQLHKGDGNKGLFIQFTGDITDDLEVPGKGYTFGTLVTAQALGDMRALENTGRKVIRFNISGNPAEKISKLAEML